MSFLDGLFKKKQCALCGGEIGLLGNNKLADGDMCDDCAEKLSPWFEGRKKATVDQIKEQLQYREQNKQAVAQFHATRTIGDYTKLYLDEMNRKFMISKDSNLREANPDVVDASAITNVTVDTRESRHELKTKNDEGRSVSYDPPRYDYSYDFYVDIDVNHPYFNHMRIKVNNSSVWVRYNDLQSRRMGGYSGNMSGSNFNFGGNTDGAGILGAVLNGLQSGMNAAGGRTAMDAYGPEYREKMMMAEDMRNSLMQLRSGGMHGTGMAGAGMGTAGAGMGMAGAGMGTVAGIAGMGAAGTGNMQSFNFNSDMEPSGKQGGFTYPVSTPVDGLPFVKLHVTGQVMYQVTDQMKYSTFAAQLPQTLYLALKEAFHKGVPGAGPQEIAMHGTEIFNLLQQGSLFSILQTFGVQPVAVTINSASAESMMGGVMGGQQMAQQQGYGQQMQQQGYGQPVQQQANMGQWFCPSCGAPNQGRFCQHCGTPKP